MTGKSHHGNTNGVFQKHELEEPEKKNEEKMKRRRVGRRERQAEIGESERGGSEMQKKGLRLRPLTSVSFQACVRTFAREACSKTLCASF